MNKIEESFLNGRILADDDWVSDGVITIHKTFIYNPVLKNYKKKSDKKLSEYLKEVLKDQKGKNISYIKKVGAKCFLMPNGRIALDIDGENYMDYTIFKLINECYYIENYVAYDAIFNDEREGKLVEILDDRDNTIGYVSGCKY